MSVRRADLSQSLIEAQEGESGRTRRSHVFEPVVLLKFSSMDRPLTIDCERLLLLRDVGDRSTDSVQSSEDTCPAPSWKLSGRKSRRLITHVTRLTNATGSQATNGSLPRVWICLVAFLAWRKCRIKSSFHLHVMKFRCFEASWVLEGRWSVVEIWIFSSAIRLALARSCCNWHLSF